MQGENAYFGFYVFEQSYSKDGEVGKNGRPAKRARGI